MMRSRLVVAALTLAVSGSVLVAGVSPAVAASDRPDTLKAAQAAGALTQGAWLSDTLTKKDIDWYRFDVAAPGRVMATLGGLPADYSLAIYDSTGTKLTTSARSGKSFERVAVNAVVGSYYVKVFSAGAYSSKAYQLKFRVPAAGVTILDTQNLITTSKGAPVDTWIAEVYNNTSTWQQVTGWHVAYYDKDGGLLTGTNDVALTYPRPVAPGKVLSVHNGATSTSPTFEPAPAGAAKLKVTLDITAVTPAPSLTYAFKVRSHKVVKAGTKYTVRVANKATTSQRLLLVVSGYTTYGNLYDLKDVTGKVAGKTIEDWTFTIPGKALNYTRIALVPGT